MKDCTDACAANAACKYWAFDFATGACTLHELLNVDVAAVEPNFVGGDRTCTDTEGDDQASKFCYILGFGDLCELVVSIYRVSHPIMQRGFSEMF